tara:strand:- start:785 stop:1693 length:909 start_codon:yes stop_codon:yes gene_type:complete
MRFAAADVIMCPPLQAGVAELADALDLGSSGVTPVEVRVLSPALFPEMSKVNPGEFKINPRCTVLRDDLGYHQFIPHTSYLMTATSSQAIDTHAGQAVYSPFVLKLYDAWVLGISNRLIWKCPTKHLLAMYQQHVTSNHLDVGVGTGYFLKKTRWPINTQLALMDMNPNSLATAAARVPGLTPCTFEADVFEPWSLGDKLFDSISMNYLLHCLPGNLQNKSVVFEHAKAHLTSGGTLFGSTLLGKDLPRSSTAKRLMDIYNRKGIFSNTEDSLDILEHVLSQYFAKVEIQTRGCCAIFIASQ